MSKRAVWICLSACIVFSAAGQGSSPFEVFEVQTRGCETPGSSGLFLTPAQPLTLQAVQRAVHQIRKSQPLLEREWDAVMQFGDYLRANLGSINLAYLEELVGRAHHRSIEAADVDFFMLALDSERATLESLNLEVAELVRNLPDDQTIPQKGWPIILYWGAVAACDLSINSCLSDVEEAWEDCESGAFCGPEDMVLSICCNQKAQDDILNCAITCGANGPDGDYGACCRPGPGG